LKICRRAALTWTTFAGWPGSNPKDVEFFYPRQNRIDQTEQAKLVAFGSTRRRTYVSGRAGKALTDALHCVSRPRLTLASDGYLASDVAGNLDMISEHAHLTTQTMDLEHLTGTRNNPEYAMACAQLWMLAPCIVLCDTNGSCRQAQLWNAVVVDHFRYLCTHIHCHNDNGMAV
jgi:isopropylmalate/homocitrate/citramalate synthase